MPSIVPNPSELGLTSLQLGPWFSANSISLPLPDTDDLSVRISTSTQWLPPTTGVLSLIVPKTFDFGGESLLHGSLVHLKKADGTPRFGELSGKMVAVFSILPEVYVRLRQLYVRLEILGDETNNNTKRPVPYQFALLFDVPADVSALNDLVDDTISNEEEVKQLGLTGTSNFDNGPTPMAWLRKPKAPSASSPDFLINIPASGAQLFAFDIDGYPIDPGAVARAFNALTDEFDNLGLGSSASLFPSTANGKTLHFVNLLSGNLETDLLNTIRVNSSTTPSANVITNSDNTLALTFDSTASTSRPFLRHALLPIGPYQSSTTLAATALMTRDYLRVAVGDVEELLTGKSRLPAFNTTNKNFQALASTRIKLEKATNDNVLLSHQEAILVQANTLLSNADPSIIISGQFSGATGATTAPSLPDIALPGRIESLVLFPVEGGQGPDSTDHPAHAIAMLAVLQVNLQADLENAWVRALPLGFSLSTGKRSQMIGGGGKAVLADGVARATILLTLPEGESTVDEGEEVAFDIEIVTAKGKILLGTQRVRRVNRPAASSVPISVTSTNFPTGVTAIYVCETANRITSGGTFQLPSGKSFIAELTNGNFSLLDTSSTPYSVFHQGLGQTLGTNDVIVTTSRVWEKSPKSDSDTQIATSNATQLNTSRNQLEDILAAGAPLPLMERHDALVTTFSNTNRQAVLSAVPFLDVYHEFSPSKAGLVGLKAGQDMHSTGAVLAGPAADLIYEFALDRRFQATDELLNFVIANDFPSAPTAVTDAAPLVAILRTVAAQVEGETQLHINRTPAILSSIINNVEDYDYTDTLDDKRTFINGVTPVLLSLPDVPASAATDKRDRMERYLDRRVLGATQGFSELIPALKNLLEKAQSFIYIETPIFDAGIELSSTDELRFIQLIQTSLQNNPNLHVLICLPLKYQHPYEGIKNYFETTRQAANAILRPQPSDASTLANKAWAKPSYQRIAIFSPYGAAYRPLDIHSTTVIVDDTVAVTGAFALNRRGLTFDSSIAMALFDERRRADRSKEVFSFRQNLVANRLRIASGLIPQNGALLVQFVHEMLAAGNNQNISLPAIATTPSSDTAFQAIYDPDGRRQSSFNLTDYLLGAIADAGMRAALADD